VDETKKPTQQLDASGRPFNPMTEAFARTMAARKGMPPVAGGPTPPIPRLDMPPIDPAASITDNAVAQRAAAAGPPRGAGPSSILASDAPPRPLQRPGALQLLGNDTLPPAAKEDPQYRQGMASDYAMSQPHLAAKYGIIRAGKHITPEVLRGEPAPQVGALRPGTVEGLKALVDANTAPREEAAAPATAPSPPPAPDPGPRPTPGNLDQFDYDMLRQALTADILNNPEQKKLIESRLAPLDFDALVMNGRVQQRIPIRPGVFEIELESLTVDEQLAIKRKIFEDGRALSAPEDYLLDLSALWQACAGLHAIHTSKGRELFPSHRDQNGDWSDDLFNKKTKRFNRLPIHLISSIGLNWVWFDLRVRRLFTAEQVGNG